MTPASPEAVRRVGVVVLAALLAGCSKEVEITCPMYGARMKFQTMQTDPAKLISAAKDFCGSKP